MTDVISIETPRNFAFESTVVSHGWYLLAPFRWERDNKVLHRTEDFEGTAFDLQIRWRKGHLLVESDADLNRVEQMLRERLERMFQLHVDTAEFLQLCRSSATHAVVVKMRFGRLLCSSSLFEDAIKVITTTNTTWRQTMRMVELLVQHYGTGGAFPTPQAIANRTVKQLSDECRLGYRSASVHKLASGIVDGSIDLQRVADPQQSTPELFKSYRSLPGIGPYGAAHLLAMDGRHDFIAVDTEFRRFVRDRYHRGRNVSDRTLLKRYARWGRWQYLAYWSELWSSIAPDLEVFEKESE